MANINPFSITAKTLQISVTSTASTSKALPSQGNIIRLVNEGTSVVYVSVGAGTQVATVPSTTTPVGTSTPILPTEDATFSIPSDQIYNISAICPGSGTATLDVQVGEGQ